MMAGKMIEINSGFEICGGGCRGFLHGSKAPVGF
jgi:hypothetical protein